MISNTLIYVKLEAEPRQCSED